MSIVGFSNLDSALTDSQLKICRNRVSGTAAGNHVLIAAGIVYRLPDQDTSRSRRGEGLGRAGSCPGCNFICGADTQSVSVSGERHAGNGKIKTGKNIVSICNCLFIFFGGRIIV